MISRRLYSVVTRAYSGNFFLLFSEHEGSDRVQPAANKVELKGRVPC